MFCGILFSISFISGCSSEAVVGSKEGTEESAVTTTTNLEIATDTDGDEIADDIDACDDEKPTVDADKDGCEDDAGDETDSDGDGIADADDACDGENAEQDDDGDGCEDDSDSDGVDDVDDACPDVAFTTSDGDSDGCEDDSDSDGIADADDACDSEIPVQDANYDGCEDDTDGDGVDDIYDLCDDDTFETDADGDGCDDDDGSSFCENFPSSCGNTVNSWDVTIAYTDSDGDGVYDTKDECDDVVPEIDVDENGCEDGPEISICLSEKDSFWDECTSYTYSVNGSTHYTSFQTTCENNDSCECVASDGYSSGYNALRIDVSELSGYDQYIVKIERTDDNSDNYATWGKYTYYLIDITVDEDTWGDYPYIQKEDDSKMDSDGWADIQQSDWETATESRFRWSDHDGEFYAFFDSYLLDEKNDDNGDGGTYIYVAGYDENVGITDWSEYENITDSQEVAGLDDCN
jgi:hypothetical protein